MRNDVVGPGSLVGRYRLVRELGRGAMGLVFLADDTVLKQQLCVKVLDPRLVHNPEALERFHREIVLARRIAHRSVCRLHDLHQEGQLHFITMEYVEGVPLRDLLISDQPYLPVGRVTTIVRNICDALAAAHDVNVIHRDLKPANVMVCAGDEINLLDFGIATADDLRSSLTLPGIAIGTRNYIAPEVWAGRPATAKSDQFSLGVLFYNCLTKQRPFATHKDVVEAMKERPRPPSDLRSEVPTALDDVVLRALSFSPNDRYGDMRKLAAAIADVVKREGISGLPGHGFDPNERSSSRSDPRASQVITAPGGISRALGSSGEPTIPPASHDVAKRGGDDAMTIPPLTLPPTTLPPTLQTLTQATATPAVATSAAQFPDPQTLPPTLPALPPDTVPEPTGLSGTSRTDTLMPRRGPWARVAGGLLGAAVVAVVALVVLDDGDERVVERAGTDAVDAAASAARGERIRHANGTPIEPIEPIEQIEPIEPKNPIDLSDDVNASKPGDDVGVDGRDDTIADDVPPLAIDRIVGERVPDEAARVDATRDERAREPKRVDKRVVDKRGDDKRDDKRIDATRLDATRADDKRADDKRVDAMRVDDKEDKRVDDSKRAADARAATQRAMTERAVLAGDDADLDRLRARAASESKAKNYDEAVALEGDARRRAEAIVVDKAFVKKKLVRFNTRFDELKDASARARLEGVSSEVLSAMREGRYEDANRALNAAFAAMR